MGIEERDQRHGISCASGPPGSAELAVLAAAAVVAAEVAFVAIGGVLAGDAEAHAWNGLAPRFRNLCSAVGARLEARTVRQPALRAQDAVRHRRIDLILYSAVAGPTRCHALSLRPPATRAYPAPGQGRGQAAPGSHRWSSRSHPAADTPRRRRGGCARRRISRPACPHWRRPVAPLRASGARSRARERADRNGG